MNEEEVIEKCKIFIDLYNGDSDWDIQDTKEAIQALLILYNQKKQKNKMLEEKIIKLQMSHYQIHQMNKRLIKQLQES